MTCSRPEMPYPTVTSDARVSEIAEAIRAARSFALDLEFVSEHRYVPELGLVQVGWGEPASPEVALVDPLAVDVAPLVELVEDPEVETLLHAAQGDLSLLARRFGARGRGIVDTQVAAAFLGLGDQVGYTRLIGQLAGVELDKGAQFTDWLRRPLSDEQLGYAAADVEHLPAAWDELARRLEARGRLGWVREESERIADAAARPTEPEEAFRRVGGWGRLRDRDLAVLQAVAAWREETAVARNKPPSWLLQDRAMIEVARRRPRDARALAGLRGVSEKTVRRHGDEIVAAVAAGSRGRPPQVERPSRALPERERTWASLVAGLVQALAREADIAPRLVGSKADAETLVRWWSEGRGRGGDQGERRREPDLALLAGWRRELAGEAALAWLAGESAVAADPGADSGIRLLDADAG